MQAEISLLIPCLANTPKGRRLSEIRFSYGVAVNTASQERGNSLNSSLLTAEQGSHVTAPTAIFLRVRPGDIGDRSYLRHGCHFWAEGIFERFEQPSLQIDLTADHLSPVQGQSVDVAGAVVAKQKGNIIGVQSKPESRSPREISAGQIRDPFLLTVRN